MLLATEVPAAPVLSSFVRCYSLSRFNTNGTTLIKPLHALHELCLTFYLAGHAVCVQANADDDFDIPAAHCITGITTQYNGYILFNGNYTIFNIHFKPNGFHKIFNLPPKTFINKMADAATILGAPLALFAAQLKSCTNMLQMEALANAFLLQYMAQRKSSELFDGITTASNIILKEEGINMEQLAQYVNMSLRNFERRFDEQVGISPKLFCRIRRFNDALRLKLNGTQKDWTSIAQLCGYFDQMHLIKDFKQFAGYTPSVFMKHTPVASEKMMQPIDM